KGGFNNRTDYLVPSKPTSLVLADMAGNGTLDIVTANSAKARVPLAADADAGANSVSVLLNAGDGTFPVRSDYQVGAGPIQVAAADVDRDGDLDLLALDGELPGERTPDRGRQAISIRLSRLA